MFAHRISKRWNWGHRRLYWRWMQYDSSKNSLFWAVFQLSKPFPHSTTTKPKHTLRVSLTAPSMRHFADTTWHQALTSTMALRAQDEATEDLSDALCGLCLLNCSPWACFPFSTIFPFIFLYRDAMVYALAFHRLKAEQMEHRSQKTLAFKTSYSKNFRQWKSLTLLFTFSTMYGGYLHHGVSEVGRNVLEWVGHLVSLLKK